MGLLLVALGILLIWLTVTGKLQQLVGAVFGSVTPA